MKGKRILVSLLLLSAALLLAACGQSGQPGEAQTSSPAEKTVTAELSPTPTDGTAADETPQITVSNEETDGTNTPTPAKELLFDDFDALDRTSSVLLSDSTAYNNGFREIEKNELVFSVASYDLQRLLWNGDGEKYDGRLIITQKASKLCEEHVFPSVTAPMTAFSWGCVDFVLKSEDYDCGFCPTAGRDYTVELAVVKHDAPNAALYEGVYSCRVNVRVKLSPYYAPTADDGVQVTRSYVVSYRAQKHGRIEGEAVQHLLSGQKTSAVRAVADEGYAFKRWSDGLTDPVRGGDVASGSATWTAIFERADKMHLAEIHINTAFGDAIANRDYEIAEMKITGAENAAYDLDTDVMIKIRGNSSVGSTYDNDNYNSKNSYSVKLFEKEKLLGLGSGKSKKWVLNSNKFDLSALRNYLVWQLARGMGTIPFVPQCTWVHLYVNGEYRGLYTLSEKVNAEKGRVEVDDSPTGDPDKGYLVELDFRGQSGDDPWFDIDGYGPDPRYKRYDAVEFVIKSDIEGDADIEFIRDYIQRCHYAMMQGVREDIGELVDLPSLVDMYIIEELSKDCDAGRASFYVCKDKGGKLFFTAPWDFDFGFGTYGQATTVPGRVSEGYDCCTWFASLITRTWFKDLVHERLEELQPVLDRVMEDLTEISELIGDDIDRNAERWNLYGRHYHDYVSNRVSFDLHDLSEHIDYIKSWTRGRWRWLLEN
ncbi:MAG: CotH kinase family protein [Clostridia bacterium]|nr:CotH kinase family protein [Clostridia bacterium]